MGMETWTSCRLSTPEDLGAELMGDYQEIGGPSVNPVRREQPSKLIATGIAGIDLNNTLGAYIRNKFDLLYGNKELLEDCRREVNDQHLHPEQSPMIIIMELWKRLRKTHKLRVVK